MLFGGHPGPKPVSAHGRLRLTSERQWLHNTKPEDQCYTSAMDKRAFIHRAVRSSFSTMKQVSIRLPSVAASAAGTNEPVWPPELTQVSNAPTLGVEPFVKFEHGPWGTFFHGKKTTGLCSWSQPDTLIPQFANRFLEL